MRKLCTNKSCRKRGIIKIIKSCRKKRNYQKRGISVQTKADQIEIEATTWPSPVTNRKRARFIEISEQTYRGTLESQRLDEMLVNTNDKSRLDGVSIFCASVDLLAKLRGLQL